MEMVVETPADGGVGVARRSREFAYHTGMRLQYSFEHFSRGEYSARLLRPDFNIAADNVLRGPKSIVYFYSRGEPSSQQRELAKEYLCTVMRTGCTSTQNETPV